MSKRFKLQTGHVVRVDDQDAWLLRSYVWRGREHNGGTTVRRNKCHDSSDHLSHVIAGVKDGVVVRHRNGDQLDFRRENLEVISRGEHMARCRAEERLYRRMLGAC